jgi:hypothetical protein
VLFLMGPSPELGALKKYAIPSRLAGFSGELADTISTVLLHCTRACQLLTSCKV